MTSWNGDQKVYAVKHRKSVQPQGYNSRVWCSAPQLTLSQTCPPQMDAALQPSALPAALLNTQVKKIKDTRCLVCQRTGFCALFGSFTSKGLTAHEFCVWRKKYQGTFKTLSMLHLKPKKKKKKVYVSVVLRRVILHLTVWWFSHKKTTLSKKREKNVRVWSCLLFQSQSFKGRK